MEAKHDTLGWEYIRLKIPLLSHGLVENCTLHGIYIYIYIHVLKIKIFKMTHIVLFTSLTIVSVYSFSNISNKCCCFVVV